MLLLADWTGPQPCSSCACVQVFPAKGFLGARTEMAAATDGSAPAKEAMEKKVELMKEVRAHEVAIAELENLHPSRSLGLQ
ncbi:hypothetical protein BS78_02G093800 [Paspalum vaginatum]|nr:hypothetical protein BS78_02G093800 [Paspalum vaginatum]